MSLPPPLAELVSASLPTPKSRGRKIALRTAAPVPVATQRSAKRAPVVPFEPPAQPARMAEPQPAPEVAPVPMDQEAPAAAPFTAPPPAAEPPEVWPASTLSSSPLNPMAKDNTAESSNAARPAPTAADQKDANETTAAPAPVSTRTLLKEAEEKLSLLRDNREVFEWILEKQSSLRTEFVGFLKKDLREIDYVVSDINDQGSKDEFAANALGLIKETYIKHWERSFELISPDDLLKQPSEKK